MADLDISDPFGLQDKRRGRGTTGSHQLAEAANMTSISAIRTRLKALNAGYYTDARLATMTKNDLVYALRQSSADSAGIK